MLGLLGKRPIELVVLFFALYAFVFVPLGKRTGFEHATIADSSGKCVRDPNAHPLMTGRIPLTPPACDPTADPLSGKKPDGTFEPNPCSFTTTHADIAPGVDELRLIVRALADIREALRSSDAQPLDSAL